MNDLLEHPAVLAGAALLIVVAVIMASKKSGPTYAIASGPTSADLKTIAEAQAVTDTQQTAARAGIMTALTGYQQQRMAYQTSRLQIATDAASTRYQTDAGVRLGLASVDAQNHAVDTAASVENNQTAAALKVNTDNNQEQAASETKSGFFGLIGNIIGIGAKILTGGLL